MSLRFRSSGAKYQLRVFINDYDDVGQEPVAILRIQFMRIPFIQILQEIRRPGLLKQRIPVRHLLTKRTKSNVRRFRCLDHSPGLLIILRIGVLRYGQIMLHEAGIIAKLRLLGVDEHQLQLGWPLSIEEGCDNHIQANRLTLLCGTGNQKMRGIRKIEDLHVAGDLLTDGDGQFSRTGTEFFRRHQLSYRYGRSHLVCDLKANTVFEYGCHHTLRLQSDRDVICQITYCGHLRILRRIDFIQCHCWPGDCLYVFHLNIVVRQRFPNDGNVPFYL